MYKLHKKFSNCFYLMVTKFILLLRSNIISKIRYSKSCILHHITYTAIEALLYQPLRFILTFKINRSMVSFDKKHCKYDMHIHFHASFLGIAFKSFIDEKDFLLTFCLLLLPLWESAIVLCFVVRYFMSFLVLQSS